MIVVQFTGHTARHGGRCDTSIRFTLNNPQTPSPFIGACGLAISQSKRERQKMSNKGIDYGLGKTNIHSETGIRFGVIPQNDIGQAWFDSSEAYYGKPHCPKCGNEAKPAKGKYERFEHASHECDDYVCHGCKYVFGSESAFPDSPVSFSFEQDGYSAECGEDGDIFIVKSPYFTYAQFCSPCAPGACYLRNPIDEQDPNNRAYCFGHDWFEDSKAPYPVYSVATGELIESEQSE